MHSYTPQTSRLPQQEGYASVMFNGECLEFKQIRFGILSAERHPQIDKRQGCLLAFLALLGVQRARYPYRGNHNITSTRQTKSQIDLP